VAKKRLDARIVAPIAFDIFQLMGLFEAHVAAAYPGRLNRRSPTTGLPNSLTAWI
jgi:hypothetical protein